MLVGQKPVGHTFVLTPGLCAGRTTAPARVAAQRNAAGEMSPAAVSSRQRRAARMQGVRRSREARVEHGPWVDHGPWRRDHYRAIQEAKECRALSKRHAEGRGTGDKGTRAGRGVG